MNALQFIELVRRMRKAQKAYDEIILSQFHSQITGVIKSQAVAKELEAMVDAAEIEITVEVTRSIPADQSQSHHWPAGIAGH